jgi:hypothetical protein
VHIYDPGLLTQVAFWWQIDAFWHSLVSKQGFIKIWEWQHSLKYLYTTIWRLLNRHPNIRLKPVLGQVN